MIRNIVLVLIFLGISAGGYYYYSHFYKKSSDEKVTVFEIGNYLNIKIDTERECQFGDFDIMGADIALTGKETDRDILLTVEPVLNRSKQAPIVSQRLTLDEVKLGMQKSYPIANTSKEQHLGIFLCKDQLKRGTCAPKPVFDYQQLQNSILNKGNQKILKSDKIFFFQYLYINQQRAQFLSENINSLEEAKQKIITFTEHIDSPFRDNLRTRINRLYDSLGSYVVIKKPTEKKLYMEIVLGMMDESLCESSAPVKVKKKTKIYRNAAPKKVFRDMGFGGK